jgi:predicted permease
MGGAFQLLYLLAVALAILVASLLVAFLVGRLFQSKRTRKWILWGTVIVYALAFVAYFGFIALVLSGNVN